MFSSSIKMVSSYVLLIFLIVLLKNEPSLGCGFPVSQPVVVGCGGGCGGGGGCCGRRKREAVQPVYKDRSVPCPQAEWRELIQQSISSSSTVSVSVDAPTMAVQTALNSRFPDNKFLVICSTVDTMDGEKKKVKRADEIASMPMGMQLSSAGDGYCNVMEGQLWCQAVSMSG